MNRIGDLNIGTDVQIAIFLALGIAGYALYKFLAPAPAPPPGSTTASSGTTLTPDQATTDAASQSDPPNYDPSQYATWAADIQSEGNRFWTSSGTNTLAIMDQIDNLADMYSLIAAFGNYRPTDAGIPDPTTYNLPTWINAAFSSAAIAAFNQQLAYNNVQFSF